MSKKTVLNELYHGTLETMSIPAEIHERERDGKTYASYGSAVPIHCCTAEQMEERSKTTHHYTGIFTEQTLAPLGELAFVRVDENTAEKVFVDRHSSMVILSSDGRLAQWRCAPTFQSSNSYIAGTPIVSASGALLSLVTAKHGDRYAITNIQGIGGYFETTEDWKVINSPSGLVYGDRAFPSREVLRDHVASLPSGTAPPAGAPTFTPALHVASAPRVALVAGTGRQIAHIILNDVIVKDIEYL